MKANDSKSIPIRIDAALLRKIEEAARLTGLPKQEIIRLCTAIGIEDLRKLNWDIAGTISKAAESQVQGNAPLLKVAETPDKEPMPKQVPVKYPKGR